MTATAESIHAKTAAWAEKIGLAPAVDRPSLIAALSYPVFSTGNRSEFNRMIGVALDMTLPDYMPKGKEPFDIGVCIVPINHNDGNGMKLGRPVFITDKSAANRNQDCHVLDPITRMVSASYISTPCCRPATLDECKEAMSELMRVPPFLEDTPGAPDPSETIEDDY